ncbi:MAG: M2 family metallopeptidase [Acidobacteria bacterium]|nr:M2 family metallopeptidase [Acidobacteriota bacterium]
MRRRGLGCLWTVAALGGCGSAQWQAAPCPSCASQRPPDGSAPEPAGGRSGPEAEAEVSAAAAQKFMDGVEAELRRLWVRRERAGWVAANFITEDTEAISAEADQDAMEYLARVIAEATRFDRLALEPVLRRKLRLLKLAGTVPAPKDGALTEELSKVTASLQSTYGKAKYCPPADSPLRRAIQAHADLSKELKDYLACKPDKPDTGGLSVNELDSVMAGLRDEPALREAWLGWHATARPMRPKYARYVELANTGAREIGFQDVGEMWRSGYDMAPDEFAADVDRLWAEVRPFYEELHCYVRSRLKKQYGELVKDHAPIPAHLLGNMWSQTWNNVYALVEPYKGESPPDVTAILKREKWSEERMVRTAEGFYTSLGLDPLPDDFWTRSLFRQPRDRDVQCHASAWDVTYSDDLRIKMCIKPTEEDLQTIHHELGHNYYFHAYRGLPILFQQGANDGFHEAIGDAVALSMTPGYLRQIKVLDGGAKSDKATVNYLMKMALDKVAFLPFGKVIDEWRWKVFSGAIAPADYNRSWWELRTRFQGVAPPGERSEADFDPGAKYHVPSNVPYIRYFLAFVYQFQFHRALCRAAGHAGPLHECSIYKNAAAGEKLAALLALGASRPWQEALDAMTGERQADAGALIEFFAPIRAFLKEQNKGQTCGW